MRGAARCPGPSEMSDEIRNALLIYNPRAGRSGPKRLHQLEEARRIFGAAGIETELHPTTAPGEAARLAQQAALDGSELIIVCGGDGTMNEALNGIAADPSARQVPLALLPGGTANVLAKELGLPWDIPAAAEILSRGTVVEIPLGLAVPLDEPAAQRYFLCVAGAGPDGMMIYAVKPDSKSKAGILAYWWEGFRQLFRYHFPRFRVMTAEHSLDATLLVVGRTKNYGGPFCITTRADLFEDCFELTAITTRSALRYLTYLPKLWLGKLRSERGVFFWKSDLVRCEAPGNETVYAQVDGESLGRLPVEFRIVPSALRLLVPAEFARRNARPAATRERRAPQVMEVT
jgi:diacylglycerol kinase (ATP)